jgi:hypothetical protein
VKQGDPITISFQRHYETPPRTTGRTKGIHNKQQAVHLNGSLRRRSDTSGGHHCIANVPATTENYLINLGMKIAPNKCASFQVQMTKDSWYISTTDLQLKTGDQFPSTSAIDIINYLGGHFSPWTGLQKKGIPNKLQQVLYRLRSASLKPHQKLHLLTTYLIPHFLCTTISAAPSTSAIRELDSLIRVHVKDTLHLPASTPNGLI